MIGLVAWCRSFQYANGQLIKNADGSPSRIAHPLQNLWLYLDDIAPKLSDYFDIIQLPPHELAQGGRGAGVDGYEAFEYRNWNGTHWDDEHDLREMIAAM